MVQTQVATTLEARAKDFIAALNDRNIDRMLQLAADDATWSDPVLGHVKGSENLRRAAQDWFTQFQDGKYEIRATITNGANVAAYYHSRAVAGGRPVEWNGAMFFTFNGQGKLQSGVEIFDADELGRQAGR